MKQLLDYYNIKSILLFFFTLSIYPMDNLKKEFFSEQNKQSQSSQQNTTDADEKIKKIKKSLTSDDDDDDSSDDSDSSDSQLPEDEDAASGSEDVLVLVKDKHKKKLKYEQKKYTNNDREYYEFLEKYRLLRRESQAKDSENDAKDSPFGDSSRTSTSSLSENETFIKESKNSQKFPSSKIKNKSNDASYPQELSLIKDALRSGDKSPIARYFIKKHQTIQNKTSFTNSQHAAQNTFDDNLTRAR